MGIHPTPPHTQTHCIGSSLFEIDNFRTLVSLTSIVGMVIVMASGIGLPLAYRDYTFVYHTSQSMEQVAEFNIETRLVVQMETPIESYQLILT